MTRSLLTPPKCTTNFYDVNSFVKARAPRGVTMKALLLACVLVAGCRPDRGPASGAGAHSSPKAVVNGLGLTFTVLTPRVKDVTELRMRVVFSNESSAPLRLRTIFLPFGSLFLNVRKDGKPLPHAPPPMPPVDDGKTGRDDLAPGQTWSNEYGGSLALQPPAAPGRYEVRFEYANDYAPVGEWKGEIVSEWVSVEIAP
jgi:hypothetical protein